MKNVEISISIEKIFERIDENVEEVLEENKAFIEAEPEWLEKLKENVKSFKRDFVKKIQTEDQLEETIIANYWNPIFVATDKQMCKGTIVDKILNDLMKGDKKNGSDD